MLKKNNNEKERNRKQKKTCYKPGASHRDLRVCRTPSEVCKLYKCLVKCLEPFQHLSDNTHTKLKISENERLPNKKCSRIFHGLQCTSVKKYESGLGGYFLFCSNL